MSTSYRSPILSGPSSPPESSTSVSASRRGSGSSAAKFGDASDGLSVQEMARIREHEEAMIRRGSEPSLSYIAVVSGDQHVSPFAKVLQADTLLIDVGHIPIRFRLGDGFVGIRAVRIAGQELL